ncbi:outer membrane scaffolding protein for murein synthesis (MipA/OmpV family) [Hypnocyclicus thermotrophus]|uniref:Outer membrane scaffolding protein for murein synthesis (MipA/OmpV family) n=1 Tax=Hypnocyclicus thermotrophus TaxID=1627895 RepID=A0AA46E088_9FUSO|nr:MipA/OmpV family protein [Hypnocyclicus thermotrophus]TDT72287.1 outer membrane scaffolding protein for murein synthesis (MipA/OmpV family) [Hypnocyclicus thermotrophus]
MKKILLIFSAIMLYSNLAFSAVENLSTGDVYLFGESNNNNLTVQDNQETLALDEFDIQNNTQSSATATTDRFQIGIALTTGKREYKEMAKFEFMPLFDIKYKQFYLDKTVAGIYIIQNEEIKVSLVGEYNMASYDASKLPSPYNIIMNNRDNEIHGGFGITFTPITDNNIEFNLRLTRDFVGKSNGFKTYIEAIRTIPYTQSIILKPKVLYTFMNRDYINYYYGVTSSEAAKDTDVTAYSAQTSGYKFGFGFDLDYQISRTFTIKSFNKIEWHSNEITESPITEDLSIEIGGGFVLSL